MPGEPKSGPRFLADVLSFGWVLPAAIAAGAGLGWLGDRLLHTSPVVTIVMAFAGAVAGFLQIYREMIVISKGDPDEPGPPS